jgi:hypothetical protein
MSSHVHRGEHSTHARAPTPAPDSSKPLPKEVRQQSMKRETRIDRFLLEDDVHRS